MIDIQIPNLPKLIASFDASPAMVTATLTNAIKVATIAVQTEAMEQAPKRTGTMAKAITAKTNGLVGVVSPNYTVTPYARYNITGTGLYGPKGQRIVPKNAKVLATKINPGWGTANKGGYFIIGRSTAGQHPNPFMARAEAWGQIKVMGIMEEATKAITEELAK